MLFAFLNLVLAASFASAAPRQPLEGRLFPVAIGGITDDPNTVTHRSFNYVICGGGYAQCYTHGAVIDKLI